MLNSTRSDMQNHWAILNLYFCACSTCVLSHQKCTSISPAPAIGRLSPPQHANGSRSAPVRLQPLNSTSALSIHAWCSGDSFPNAGVPGPKI